MVMAPWCVESITVPCIGGGCNVGVKWDDPRKGGTSAEDSAAALEATTRAAALAAQHVRTAALAAAQAPAEVVAPAEATAFDQAMDEF